MWLLTIYLAIFSSSFISNNQLHLSFIGAMQKLLPAGRHFKIGNYMIKKQPRPISKLHSGTDFNKKPSNIY